MPIFSTFKQMTFKPTKLALSLSVSFGLLATSANINAAGSSGDLTMYSPQLDPGTPTFMFMVETSTFMNSYDTVKWLYGNEEVTDSSGNVSYKRFYTYNLNQPKYYSRITRLKDSIFHLMDATDEEGEPLIPADFNIGIGNYTSMQTQNNFDGERSGGADPVGSSLVIPAKPIGGINSEHRMAIKRYVAGLCNNTNNCTGEAPMAIAYAEVGAYMMGTKTAPIINSGDNPAAVSRVRRFRKKGVLAGNQWQICTDADQRAVTYEGSSFRYDCSDDNWKDINATNSQSQFGYEWDNTWNKPRRVGLPIYDFVTDGVQDPFNGWTYFVDQRNIPDDMPTLSLNITDRYYGTGIRNASMSFRNGRSLSYQQPEYSECSGTEVVTGSNGDEATEVGARNGIIFFTAGFPRNGVAFSPEHVMNMSLTPADENTENPVGGPLNCNSGLDNTYRGFNNPINNNWHCMGGYAKRLNSLDNPLERKTKTSVVLFSSNDEVMSETADEDGNVSVDCNGSSNAPLTIQNACKLASEDYGDGEIIQTTQNRQTTANNRIVSLINSYNIQNETSIGLTAAALPSFPVDPFNLSARLKEAYLPLISPDTTGSQAQWQGNLRKYKLTNNGVVDKLGNNPYSGSQLSLASNSLDFWSDLTEAYNAKAQAGGAYEQIPYPLRDSSDNIRKVFYGDSLTRVLPDAALLRGMAFSNVSDENQDNVRRNLLHFMGYNLDKFVSTSPDGSEEVTTNDMILATADGGEATRNHAAVMHSNPLYIAYKGRENAEGRTDVVDAKVVYGAFDNALHVVDAESGKEEMSFIPKETLAGEAYKALSRNEVTANGPFFGVDAPWVADVTYDTTVTAGTGGVMQAGQVNIYGGLRLGGKAYYGLDITNTNRPRKLFKLSTETGFERMAYTWAKPVIAEIKWEGERKRVIIVPGGYDRHYDTTNENLSVQETMGNAVYVVDAETGEELITIAKSTSQGATSGARNSNIKYSVVGSPKTLDRNNDGIVDHIYFADLGGQVFRVDLNSNDRGSAETSVKRVVRIANLATSETSPGPRFYETPLVTIHSAGGSRFAVVSVASGDRSNPSYKNAVKNRLFAIIDKDVVRNDLYQDTITLNTSDIRQTDLISTGTSSADVTNLLSTESSSGRKDGWSAALDRFGSATGVDFLKAYGPLAAISNDLYVGVYNYYDTASEEANQCAPAIRGLSEVNQFCLPFGYCLDNDGNETTNDRSRFSTGRGITTVEPFNSLPAAGEPEPGALSIVEPCKLNPAECEPCLEENGQTCKKDYKLKPAKLLPARWFEMSYKR